MPRSIRSRATLQTHILRLLPGEDLRATLLAYVRDQDIHGAFVMGAVGSLSTVVLRPAGRHDALTLTGDWELVALNGTLGDDGSLHLHLVAADADGQTRGGHLLEGAIVRTTAEIVLGEPHGVTLRRAPDPATGYAELTWD